MLHRTAVLLAVVGCTAALGVAGCGSKNNSAAQASASSTPAATASATGGTTHFAKTKFVLHAALAFGAFHHFIYNPAKAGDFKHAFTHKLTIVKAGLAAAFVYHELKLTAQDVRSSKILSTLFAPLTIVADKVKGLGGQIKGGNTSQVDGINSSLSSIQSTAAANGQGFSDQIPSGSQLAAGAS
jgi:hypothetical protein